MTQENDSDPMAQLRSAAFLAVECGVVPWSPGWREEVLEALHGIHRDESAAASVQPWIAMAFCRWTGAAAPRWAIEYLLERSIWLEGLAAVGPPEGEGEAESAGRLLGFGAPYGGGTSSAKAWRLRRNRLLMAYTVILDEEISRRRTGKANRKAVVSLTAQTFGNSVRTVQAALAEHYDEAFRMVLLMLQGQGLKDQRRNKRQH